jgi:quercetin dioxygenase-like cupin family protein
VAIVFDATIKDPIKPGIKERIGRILAQGENIQVIQYIKKPGGITPEHSHPEELIGILIKGKQESVLNGKKVTILPGMGYYIPPNENHGPFTNISDETSITLDIVSPPRIMDEDKPKK